MRRGDKSHMCKTFDSFTGKVKEPKDIFQSQIPLVSDFILTFQHQTKFQTGEDHLQSHIACTMKRSEVICSHTNQVADSMMENI